MKVVILGRDKRRVEAVSFLVWFWKDVSLHRRPKSKLFLGKYLLYIKNTIRGYIFETPH
jgi:hypothetical protein